MKINLKNQKIALELSRMQTKYAPKTSIAEKHALRAIDVNESLPAVEGRKE